MFDGQQPVTGVPETVFEGLQRTQNSTVNVRDQRFILVRALLSSNSLYVQSACSLLRWIDCMIVMVKGGAPYLSLYREKGKGTYLVLVGYKRRVIVLLQNLAFIVSQLSRSEIA